MKVECAYDELVFLGKLVPNPRNPNIHTDEQLNLLAKIMKHQGVRAPIVVSKRSGFMTKGHGRLEAAKINEWEQFPVDFQEYPDEASEYADMVADNEIARLAKTDMKSIYKTIQEIEIPDFDLLGIPDFTPPKIFTPGSGEDDVPKEVEPKTKLGDLFRLGDHRLLCGDSTDMEHVSKLMGEETAQFCFTSPPYSDQREYGGNLVLDPSHLAKFLKAPVDLFAVNLGMQRKNGAIFPYWNEYISFAQGIGLPLISWNIWSRKGMPSSIGNLSAMFPIEHEWIFVFGKKRELNKTIPNKHAGQTHKVSNRNKDGSMSETKEVKINEFRPLGSIVEAVPKSMGKEHPAAFPVELADQYISACADFRTIVYDPFAGSGSTLISCEKTDHRCFAMEIDPRYCDVIITRWEKYSGKRAELIGANGKPFSL